MRWLTGQIPQMRAMSEGISVIGRPSTNFSNPRNWVTWNRASFTRPSSPSRMVIFAWPSMRVTGSMVMVRFMEVLGLFAEAGQLARVGDAPRKQLGDDEVDGVRGRGTSWKKRSTLMIS